jgi:DNA (cytosine-5)-methyltransferase 1
VLIGGPPCQAYSLVGRSRNRGNADYRPEEDHRHFLYREYLRIIQKYRPAIFVMENVKGILSASINDEQIFHTILGDLVDPDRALGKVSSHPGYRIHSISHDVVFDRTSDVSQIDPQEFVVRAEDYGIPQARHRVILLGIREDFHTTQVKPLTREVARTSVKQALAGLPARRSRLTKQVDSDDSWGAVVRSHFAELAQAAYDQNEQALALAFAKHEKQISSKLQIGSLRAPGYSAVHDGTPLKKWYTDPKLSVWLNHETRGHMSSDLLRYAFASAYAEVNKRSPKGHEQFILLEKLKPEHANWETGKFSDRFRVQLYNTPATTVTSHISKDGHYFIHPDPSQCRSLTVREAARLQTFPDNYFFQGNRTQQYHQVGNAVPPLLARQIAETVLRFFSSATRAERPILRLKKAA